MFTWTLILVAGMWNHHRKTGKSPSGPALGAVNKSSMQLRIKIGNYFMCAPYGISIIVNNATAFEIQPVFHDQPVWNPEEAGTKHRVDVANISPGITAPDFSYVQTKFECDSTRIIFTWGRIDSAEVVGMFQSDKSVDLTVSLPGTTWPNFHTIYNASGDGVTGYGITPKGEYIPFKFVCDPNPVDVKANLTPGAEMVLRLNPNRPVQFEAGVGTRPLPEMKEIGLLLDSARERYETFHLTSRGPWGNFLSAISDNLNFSKLYSSDNGRVVHVVGRGWWIGRRDPNLFPYFAWDSFLNGILACQEDPVGVRNTIRAVLSFQTPEGFIPLDSHWSDNGAYVTMDRSDPPVGAMAVWEMNQRWPDKHFLEEVYPKLVRWHEWWMKARDGNHDGLLEWGSEKKFKQGAMWETGWDDNVEYDRAHMVGTTLNADAVDLNSLYSMDAEYLAKIAALLGRTEDARRFEAEHKEMNRRINEDLWNSKLGVYCSKLWNYPKISRGKPDTNWLTRLTPMNFYPLAAGVPDSERAAKVLATLYNKKEFWLKRLLPTVARTDPVWHEQSYWHGNVWPPANYLVWLGLKRYADRKHIAEFAGRCIELFMRNWEIKRICGENYSSITGECNGDPHYTWGALLPLIGEEALVGIDGHDMPVPRDNPYLKGNIEMRHVPIGGKLYTVVSRDGKIEITSER